MNKIFSVLEYWDFYQWKWIGKSQFSLKKWKFEPIGKPTRTAKFLALGKALLAKLFIYIYIYIYMRSICGKQLFRSLRAHQRSSDQMKILKDQSAQTTTRVVGVACQMIVDRDMED